MKNKYTGKLGELTEKALNGTAEDVDFIMGHLNKDSNIVITRFVDFSLSLVQKPEGKSRLEYYLFNGTLIQRNYSSLYFNRLYDFEIVLKAFKEGFIDEIQAFAR